MSTNGPAHFPHLTIRASAGTGKTYQLTKRYLGLLAAGERPDRILATTFTRKAAGEILERVLQRLAKAAMDADERGKLGGEIGVPKLAEDRVKALLAVLLRSLHRLRICTLDSFFLQIAGSFGLELDLSPGWRILDEPEDRRLRHAAVLAMLRGAEWKALLTILQSRYAGELRRPVADEIQTVVRGLHELYLDTEDAPGAWSALPDLPDADPAGVRAAAEALACAEAPKTQKGAPNAVWTKALAKCADAAERGDWEAFAAEGLVAAALAGRKFARLEVPPPLREACNALAVQARAHFHRMLRARTASARGFLEWFDRVHAGLQRERGGLRFGDVTRVLADAALKERLADVYYRLDGRIVHLLLDEFQDTSLPQWRVLEPFAEEVVAHADGSHSFFCVGDAKQAIYGWRGGVAEIFDHLRDRFPGVQEETLDRSRRSAPPVLDAVNAVFGGIAGNATLAPDEKNADAFDARPAARAWGEGFRTHETAHANRPGHVRLVVGEAAAASGGNEEEAGRDEEDGGGPDPSDGPGFAAREVARLAREAPRATVGVLVRDNRSVGELIRDLRDLGIPASEEGGMPLTDSPAVLAALSLITLADHPGDSVARFHAAASPLGAVAGLTDPFDRSAGRRAAARIRRRLVEEGYGPVLSGWVRAAAPACDARDLHRLVRLVELGRRHDAEPSLRPSDFVAAVAARKVEDPTAARVRVMTIHQAKGLEFDVVVLPDLGDSMISVWRKEMMAVRGEPAGPVTKICAYAGDAVRRICPDVARLHDEAATREFRESLCVLYVAMTRAVHALHLIVPAAGARRLSAARLVQEALANGREAGPGETLYEHGDPRWHEKEFQVPGSKFQVPGVTSGDASEPATWNLEPGTWNSSRGLPRRTPSDLEGGVGIDLSKRLRLDDGVARGRGILIHAFFEAVGWLDDGAPSDDDLRAAARRATVPRVEVEAAIREFRAMLERPAVRDALTRGRSPDKMKSEVWRERPFAVRDGDAILTGKFDRVVVGSRGGKIEGADVIDFKTDAVEAGDAVRLDALTEHYRPQLEAYRRAAAKLTGLAPAKVRAKILFVGAGEAREV